MMTDTLTVLRRPLEKALVRLTTPPWHAGYLVPIGFVILPIFHVLTGSDGSASAMVGVFVSLLLLVRVITMVLRRLLRVSAKIQSEWSRNRLLAKHYDSYQWQKLFWVGVGMALYVGASARVASAQIMLAMFCLSSGATGMIIWRIRRMTNTPGI